MNDFAQFISAENSRAAAFNAAVIAPEVLEGLKALAEEKPIPLQAWWTDPYTGRPLQEWM